MEAKRKREWSRRKYTAQIKKTTTPRIYKEVKKQALAREEEVATPTSART